MSQPYITPPPEIRQLIHITCEAIGAGGKDLENRLSTTERSNSKYSFLNPNDPYHAYYTHSLTNAPASVKSEKEHKPEYYQKITENPEEIFPHVISYLPISSLDLDLIRLTSIYSACNDSGFLSLLVAREIRNTQFEFLKVGHSLNNLYKSLTSSYEAIFNSDLNELYNHSFDSLLNKISRLSHVISKSEASSKVFEVEDNYENIDWNSFVIADVVDFSIEDKDSSLLAPLDFDALISAPISLRQNMYSFSNTPTYSPAIGEDPYVICPVCKGRVLSSQYEQHIKLETLSRDSLTQKKSNQKKYEHTALESSQDSVKQNVERLHLKRSRLE